MPKHCSAFGCSNRDGTECRSKGIKFHEFPKDDNLKREWVKVIRRENFVPTKTSYLCSCHFKSEDYFTGKTERGVEVKNKRLKFGVIPSIFEGMPQYYQPKV